MKNRLKKALSLLMALSILCSFAVLPASAAAAGSNVEIKVEAGDWTGAKGSEQCTVTVYAEAQDDFQIASAGFSFNYDSDLMTCTSTKAGDLANTKLNESAPGKVLVAAANDENTPSVSGRITLMTATLQVKSAESEKQTSVLKIEGNAQGRLFLSFIDTTDSNATVQHTVTGGETSTIVPGTEPALNSVTLAKNSIADFNGAAETFQASAAGGMANVDVTAMVSWSISPENKGVTIDAETGLISVAKNAQSDTYTVTATPVAGQTSGTAKTAELTITRATAVASEVTITEGPTTIPVPKEDQDPSTATYAAEVKNQFGEVMTDQTVTWSMTTTSDSGVTFDASTAKVTVTKDATLGKTVTVTATCGGVSKSVTAELVEIQVTPIVKEAPVYGDTWEQIVIGYTAKVGNVDVPGSYTLANPKAMPAAGEGRSTTMTFNSTDGRYKGITVPVTVNVAKLTINPKLDDQKVEWTGEEIVAKPVEYKVEKTGETLTLLADGRGTAVDSYDVAYTLSEEDAANYILGEVEGGKLVIEKAEVPADKVSQKPLEDFKLYDDVDVSVTKDSSGNVTHISVRIPRNSAKEDEIADDLAKANKKIVLTVEGEDGTKYEFTIKSWKLEDGKTFNSTGSNIFVPDELVGKTPEATAYLKNHAPKLPEFEVRMTASATSGAGGGSSSGVWGDRGNQTINLTPASIFTDVPDGYTFQTDIMWVYYRGVMKGTSATTFSPTSNTNRQQLWMVLGRLSGSNPGDMATARAWAINTGVSDGSNATGSLTRQQMVTMLYRWAQSKGYTGVTTGSISGYADASSVAGYARDAMAWAVGNGILHGSGNTLMPNGTATRAQFAAIMHRFCEKFGV